MLSNETVNIWSHLLGFLLFFTLGVCMLCSVGYHLFSCHRSESTCRRWLALDYAGISVGILGCYVPGIYYAFFCNTVHPRYLSNDWRQLRTAIFCGVAGCSIVPAFHWVWLNGGLRTDAVEVPERYFPGQMNYLGASHQVWHVLVVLMFYWWHQTAVYIMRFRHSQPCPGRGRSIH
ncbi:hypothetical protein CRUP_018298 [Coryphaenoides rupestris]|nr:hypothetical protein CRUP_018298 [Coryphaenoides rupestris]